MIYHLLGRAQIGVAPSQLHLEDKIKAPGGYPSLRCSS